MTWIQDNIASILIGVFSSVASSFVYLWAVSRIRPKVKISTHIAVRSASTGQKTYVIKIVNRTRRPLINVRARLDGVRPLVVPGGVMVGTSGVKLVQSTPMAIGGFKRHDKDAEYAFRFRTIEDLAALWPDDDTAFVRFRLLVTDSLSGFSRLFQQDFIKKDECLIVGTFGFGSSLDVHP